MCGGMKTVLFGYMMFLVFSPVILVSPTEPEKKDCGTVPVEECLMKLQTFLKLTALPFTSDQSELDELCNTTVGGYNCSSTKVSTPNCLPAEYKDLFPVYINMAEYSFFMFCNSGPDNQAYLRDALLENSDCVRKQKEALDCCAKQSNLPEFPIMYILDRSSKSIMERQISACCPVAHYIKCVKSIVESNCGEVAGNMTTEYIRRASGEQMESVCQKMPKYPDPDPEVCQAPAPVCAGSRIGTFMELIALMSLVYFVMWNKEE